jgi:hypothetical protein
MKSTYEQTSHHCDLPHLWKAQVSIISILKRSSGKAEVKSRLDAIELIVAVAVAVAVYDEFLPASTAGHIDEHTAKCV